jgi:hypothetical protein
VKDIADAPADMERFAATLVKGLQEAVSRATDIGLDAMHVNHRWTARTGKTAQDINGTVAELDNGAAGTIIAGGNAARLASGTPAHMIYPRVARGTIGPLPKGQKRKGQYGAVAGVLVFQIGGRKIFAKYVNHPGTQPDPYLDQGAEQAEAALDRLVDAAVDRALGF